MALTLLTYLVTLFLTHHIASLVQASLHCYLGHREVGGSLYNNHLYYHHGIYSEDAMVSETYMDEEESLTSYYFIPVMIIALLGYVFLPFDVFLVHISSLALSFYAHVYLHVQYHLRDTWLKRFKWFERKQTLHLLHHKNMLTNYAVVEFFWDKVLGTYQDVPVSMKS